MLLTLFDQKGVLLALFDQKVVLLASFYFGCILTEIIVCGGSFYLILYVPVRQFFSHCRGGSSRVEPILSSA